MLTDHQQSCAQSLPPECDGSPSCICQKQDFMWGVECCIANQCNAADQVKTFQFASQLCSYVNVTISSPPTCSAAKTLPSGTTFSTVTGAATATPTSVNGYAYKGCYSEATNGSGNRALNETYNIDPNGMTVESCTSYCKNKGFSLAGLEYSQE